MLGRQCKFKATRQTEIKKWTMKILATIILTILLTSGAFAQNKNSLKNAADRAVKAFTWDIQKSDKGSLMFLDVPYTKEGKDSAEYLSLTVAKAKSKERPDFISVIIPNNIVQSNGIFIKFAKTVTKNGDWTMEMEKGNPVRINFEQCDEADCTARIIDGYATHDGGKKEDVFKKFMDFDHVLFLFVYPDGSYKSVAVPLFSFKQQYKTL
jgi:hypothetical protein